MSHAIVGEHPACGALRPRLERRTADRGLEPISPWRSSSAGGGRSSPNGRITITAIAELGRDSSSSRSHSRSSGLYGSCTCSKRPVRSASRELRQRVAVPVRDADAADAPASRSSSSHVEVLAPADEVVHLLDVDAAEPVELAPVLLAALLERLRPDLRRERRVLAARLEREPSDASAPYIGDVSMSGSRPRAPRRRPRRASATSPSNVLDVPRPITGPSVRSSISRALPVRALPAANAAAKNARSSSGPRPMCESGSPAQASASRRRRRPRALEPSALEPGRPGDRRGRGRASSTARVWWETPRWRSRASASETRSASTGRPPSAIAAFAASAAASPPWPSGEPVPTMPGPIAQTTTSKPAAVAQASADATPTHCDVAVDARRRRRPPSRPGRAPSSARTVSDSETGSAPPASWTYATRSAVPSPRRRARPGCAASSRRRACPSSDSASRPVLLGVRTACWSGVYGSFITCAPASAAGRARA